MAGSSNLLNFLLQLLSNPAAAQAFLSDSDHGIRSVDVDDVIEAIAELGALWGTSGHAPITAPAFFPGATAGGLLDTFVTTYYATNPVSNGVIADGRVTQAFAAPGAVSVAAGKEAEEIVAATTGSVAIDGKVDESAISLGGIAAGEELEIEDNDDIIVGDGNVNIEGSGNTVVGDDQTVITGSAGVNVAGDNSIIQDASNGGINAGVNAIDESNIAGKNQAQAGTGDAFANDGNVAIGADSVATNGNVAYAGDATVGAEGVAVANQQAAGEDSNQVSDADVVVINQDLALGAQSPGTGWEADGSGAAANETVDLGAITLNDNDVIAAGYDDSRAIGDNSVLATGLVSNVSQDNDTFTNVQDGTAGDGGAAGIGGAGGGGVANSGPQSITNDTNSGTGADVNAADDEAVLADDESAAAGHAGNAQAAADESQVADDDGVAANDSNVAYSSDGPAAVATQHGNIAQNGSVIAGDDAFVDNDDVEFEDSYNEDSVHTEGDFSPVANDDSEIDEYEVEIDD